MTKEKLKHRSRAFSTIEVLIVVAIFAILAASISVATRNRDMTLFLDECEMIRNFAAEAIEIATTERASFSIAVSYVYESGQTAKAVVIGCKKGGREKYEYLYLKHANMAEEAKCTFDGVSFTMTPALTWRIWKPDDQSIRKTLTISGNGYCTLE